jgi:hypothetical protein
MRNHNSKPKYLKNLTGFPKKDTGSITLIESDNPNFTYEVYDYRGIFVGYMGNKCFQLRNPQTESLEIFNQKNGVFRKKDENINSINIINGINEENSRADIL